MNHITIELCAEDRKRLDTLTEALTAAAEEYGAIIRNMPNAVTGLPEAPEAPAEEDKPEPKQEEPAVTLADIRALVQKLVAPGSTKKAEATAVVKSYAAKVGDIPADKYTEVWQKLTTLEKEA